ncbi:hypothetical protein IFR05_013308 [Cadophora sp. M221]|nr:hypothetical protein IFR05_013308 [Cadophora sp. M221]
MQPPEYVAPRGALSDDGADIDQWIERWTTGAERDKSLWEIFRGSFEEWGDNRFGLLGDRCPTLRSALTTQLARVVKEKEMSKWPPLALEAEIKKDLNSWRNHRATLPLLGDPTAQIVRGVSFASVITPVVRAPAYPSIRVEGDTSTIPTQQRPDSAQINNQERLKREESDLYDSYDTVPKVRLLDIPKSRLASALPRQPTFEPYQQLPELKPQPALRPQQPSTLGNIPVEFSDQIPR